VRAVVGLHGVHAAVAGSASVEESLLRKKLGEPAWHVWQVLIHNRDATGVTSITRRGIAKHKRFTHVPGWQVMKAMTRLRLAGLVVDAGWKVKAVPQGTKVVVRKVFERVVRGACLLPIRGIPNRCLVPDATRMWMANATARGGARAGAGRKPDKPGKLAGIQTGSVVCHCDRSGSGNSNWVDGIALGGIQTGSPIEKENMNKRISGDGTSLPSVGKTPAAASAAVPLLEFEGGLAGGATRMGPPLGAPLAGVPRFPGNSVVGSLAYPDAPMLDPTAKPAELAAALARAFRGVVEARYGGRCWVLAKGDITGAKPYKALVAFATLLIDHEIPPAAWCAHRIDKWRATEAAKSGRQPTLNYVFSPKAISDELRWQYRQEYGDSKLGGRVIFTKAHLDLLRRYQRMHNDITSGTPREVAVDAHFPDGLYDVLVDRARMEIVEERNRLESMIKRGVFVW
jgi:hypothetical protein